MERNHIYQATEVFPLVETIFLLRELFSYEIHVAYCGFCHSQNYCFMTQVKLMGKSYFSGGILLTNFVYFLEY